MPKFTTNDGVQLFYATKGPTDATTGAIVLVHGWSGSHRYFDNSIDLLAAKAGGSQIIAVDLRFHGESDKPDFGFHVSRLAADLRDLIVELGLVKPVILGSSLGCAIIWSYVELFGDAGLGKLVFVDQAPSQWMAPTMLPAWEYGSKGIYDAASLANIQNAVKDMHAFAKGNAECCLTKPIADDLMAVLTEETLKCEPLHLGRLMADHAQIDWRPILPRITRPCLNLYGSESGCFPVEGTHAVGEAIPDCENVCFDGCNHWLYLEEPERFATLVAEFAAK